MGNDWHDVVDRVLQLQEDPDIDSKPGPSLQWYPEKWMSDPTVMLMGMAARGVHFHLLNLAWKGFSIEGDAPPCSLDPDPEILRAISQRPNSWDEIWPEVKRAWKEYRDRLWNLGLCRAYLSQMENRRRRSRAGKKAAQARWRQSEGPRPEKAASEQPTALDADHPTGSSESHSTACDSNPGATTGEDPSHANGISTSASDDTSATAGTLPFSVSVSHLVSIPVGEERAPVGETIESKAASMPNDIASLAIPKADRFKLLRLLDNPDHIDPAKHRAHKLTDERAVREERLHLLAQLAHGTATVVGDRAEAGTSADSALDLWNLWRQQRKSKVKAESRPWFSEVQTLRKLLDGNHSAAELLDALLAAGAAGWQGFEWAWLGRNSPARGGERHPPGAAGFLPPEDDGIAV